MSATAAKLSFKVRADSPDLRLCVKLNDSIIYDAAPGPQHETIAYKFDDTYDQDHVLRFEMSGKLPEHTTVSDSGEILNDAVIQISDLAFDDIELGHAFIEQAQYRHDTNGTTDTVVQPFYGNMGCNGCIEMRFSSPIYLWLLENM
jgi:hypothetical protein